MFGSTGIWGDWNDFDANAKRLKFVIGLQLISYAFMTFILIISVLAWNNMYDSGYKDGIRIGNEEGIEIGKEDMRLNAVKYGVARWVINEDKYISFEWKDELILEKEERDE